MNDETLKEEGQKQPSTTTEFAPGEQIAARYEVIDVLGRGGSATVYRVLDHVTDEQVAIKIVADPVGGVEAMTKEVRLAWRVTHANVLRVFDIVEHPQGALISMQYASGGTLEDKVGEKWSDDQVRSWALPILAALEAAHTAGVVHRDLKPANILLDGSGQLLLSDFGVAQRSGGANEAGRGGTPAYMAPEQLAGEAVDGRTDLYALGIILYQLLSGELPFGTPGDTTTLNTDTGRTRSALPVLSASSLAPVVTALTHPDPKRRPADVAAVRELIAPPPSRIGPRLGMAAALFAVVALVWLVVVNAPRPEPIVQTLTAGDEVVEDAVTSLADGTLVFSSNRLGGVQIWALDQASTARPLTRGSGIKLAPQVVGDSLYFQLAGMSENTLYRLGIDQLDSARALSESERVVTDVEHARVSIDGRVLSMKSEYGFDHQARMRIWNPKTGEWKVVGPGEREITKADWSPDGSRVVFVTRDEIKDERGSLWLLDPETDETRLLTDDIGAWTGFVFLDEHTLAFFRGPVDGRSLVSHTIETAEESILASRLAHATLPSVTATGELVFITDRMEWSVWVYDPQGDRPLDRVTSFGSSHAKSPSWVPATEELVYVVESPETGLEVVRVDDETFADVRARRAIGGNNPYVAFSPDGRFVAYAERDGSGSRMMLASIDSEEPPRTLGRGDPRAELMPIEFALGGTRVTYVFADVDGTAQVREVGLDGRDDRLLVDEAGRGIRSQDGLWISYQRRSIAQTGGVLIDPVGDDGLPAGERILVPHTASAAMMRFGPGETELTLLDKRSLYVVDFESGARTQLADLPRGTYYVDRLSVHPDGRVAMMLGVGRRSLVRVANLQELR